MNIDQQLDFIGKFQSWCHEDADREALAAIRLALEDYRRIMDLSNGDPSLFFSLPAPVPVALAEETSRYQSFIKRYDTFCRWVSGAGAKMDGVQGKAMKAIIKYLIKESKASDEQGALDAWDYVLTNWAKLSPFIQTQISLVQINKNLAEILMQLRKNGKTASEQTAASVRASIRAGRGSADEGHQ